MDSQSVPHEHLSSQPSSPVDIETFTHNLYQAHSASNSNGIQVWKIKTDTLVDWNTNCPPEIFKGLNQSMWNSWRSHSVFICYKSNMGHLKFKISSLLSSAFSDFCLFLLMQSLQLVHLPDIRKHGQVRENAGMGKGTIEEKRWWASSDVSARPLMVSRPQCEEPGKSAHLSKKLMQLPNWK